MHILAPNLVKNQNIFIDAKDNILLQWVTYESPQKILKLHNIDIDKFVNYYASGVFDYFMGVISSKVAIGDCPVMQELLDYLKDVDIRADELFEICSNFRRSMIDFTYDVGLNSRKIVDEIYYIFDKNFQGILRYYTDTIFQKEQEINRHVKLLNEYQKALDESAIVSKTDMNGIITYVNDKFIRLSGFKKSELVGSKYSMIKHAEMPQDYFNDMWFQLKNAGIFRGTIKNNKKNGDYFYMDATIVKITDPYDNSSEYMSIATDVTKLIDARLEAQKASQAKEYFLSNMSHEIRTPLNAILGFVNLLIEQDISKQHRKYLEIILSSGENLLSIINDILDFSKLRSGEFTIEPKAFSIHGEIGHALELFVASANSKNITITSFIDPTIPKELYADSLRIKQILSNFLSNAIKFTKLGGHIHVEVTCEKNILKVSVEDNGIGILRDDLKNIFSAFTQATHDGVKNIDGTGLGLSICYQLSKHMHGDIFVESKYGFGSKFWVEIPVEIHHKECQIFSGLDEIRALKCVLFQKEGNANYKVDSFLKYSKIFNIDIQTLNTLECDYDVAILLEEDIDEKLKKIVSNPEKKYIVLTNHPTDKYEKYSHISCICFPLYCSKIKNSFDELLHPDSSLLQKQKKSQKFFGHILVAEDNEANQELIKIILMKYGLTFDLVSNGLEAFELYKTRNYDLILMDEQMPIMDGNRATQKILKYEKDKLLKHTPISALTANIIKGAKERGLGSGFDSFLGKPIVIKELEKVFKKFLKSDESILDSPQNIVKNSAIAGVDAKALTQELMLTYDELIMLLELFIAKMKKQLPELKSAIEAKDYKKIASIAHSIKGSSSNFRVETIFKNSAEIEKMAREESAIFDYMSIFQKIKTRVEEIKIDN